MSFGASTKPEVVVLTAKKLDVVIALVKVEIEIAATFRAFQQAGERARFLGDSGCPFHALNLFLGGPVNDSLVDVEEDRPVGLLRGDLSGLQ